MSCWPLLAREAWSGDVFFAFFARDSDLGFTPSTQRTPSSLRESHSISEATALQFPVMLFLGGIVHFMPIPQLLRDSLGSWKGPSTLQLTHLPENERIRKCESTLHLKEDPNGQYARLSYVWDEDGPQYGDMIIASNKEETKITIGWSDSWHQNSEVMLLSGSRQGDGSINTLGEFSSPEWGTWGWRITFEAPAKDKFTLRMFIISPQGEEEWAVISEFARASG